MSKIITEFDVRHYRLNDLWSRVNESNYRVKDGQKSLMLLPMELCIVPIDRWTGRGNHIKYDSSTDLLVSSNSYRRLLLESTGLSVQEYYDLVVLHINNTEDRPRCKWCNKELRFHNQLNHNYGLFCNSSHSELFMQMNPDYSPATANHKINDYCTEDSRIFSKYKSALSHGPSNEIIQFYITESNGRYKYGITRDLKVRESYSRLDGLNYRNSKVLLTGTRDLVCKLEYELTKIFRSEFISPLDLNKFIDEFNRLRMTIGV